MKAVFGFSRVLAVVGLAVGIALLTHPAARVLASVTNVSASPGAVVFPNTSTVTVTTQETGAGSITVQVASGTLTLISCTTTVACTSTTNNGPGSSVQVTNAGDGDGSPSETMTLVFQFSPPNVAFATTDPVQACQGGICDSDSVDVFPSGFSSATNISFDIISGTVTCGNSVVVSAFVTSNGLAVPDGTIVVFSANNGLASVGTVTSGGFATANIFVPIGVTGSFVITASSGGATFSAVVAVNCSVAGPPASITLNITPQTITCGSTASVLARVFDLFGNPVTNGTVTFTSTLGSITPTAPLIALTADGVLTSFPQQPGVAVITARIGNAVATGNVTITCPSAPQTVAPTAVPPVVQPTARPATPGVLPPNTGEAGLK